MQNAWLLYRSVANEQSLDRLNFLGLTQRVAMLYLSSSGQTAEERPGVRMTPSFKVLPEVRYDRLDHLIVSSEKQIRCALCNKKVQRMCQKCKVWLHMDCSAPFHKK